MTPATLPAAAKIDPKDARLLKEFKQPGALMGCCYDAAGKYVFAAGRDFSVLRFDVATGEKAVMAAHQSWVRGMAFSAAAGCLVTADYHGQLVWWDALAATPKALRTVAAHDGWSRAVAASPDGKSFASCGNDRLVKLWSASDGRPLATLAGHDSHVYNVAFHPDGKSLASADLKGVVTHWDLAGGKAVRRLDAGLVAKYDPTFKADIGGVRAMAFDRPGNLLACAGITDVTNAFAGIGKPVVVLFDWATGKQKLLLRPKADANQTAWGVAFHPDGFLIGVGSGRTGSGAAWFWRPDAAAPVHELLKVPTVRDVAIAPDGKSFATASVEGTVGLYDLTPKKA